MRNLFFTAILISLSALSFTSPLRQKLIGVWKIQFMEMKGTTLRHEEIGLPFIEFNEEGGFMVKLSSSAEKGRYTIKGNEVTLKFLYPKKPVQKITVTKLDGQELNYTTTDSTGAVKVKCYRITTGLDGGEKD